MNRGPGKRAAAPKLRARCPVCGKVKAVQPPKGGDGSVDVFPRHRGGSAPCPASRSVVDRSEYVDP